MKDGKQDINFKPVQLDQFEARFNTFHSLLIYPDGNVCLALSAPDGEIRLFSVTPSGDIKGTFHPLPTGQFSFVGLHKGKICIAAIFYHYQGMSSTNYPGFALLNERLFPEDTILEERTNITSFVAAVSSFIYLTAFRVV